MDKDNRSVEEQAFAIIAETLDISPESFHLGSKIADITEDSIQLFELLLAFESAYEMETVYEDVVKMQTVQDIVDYLNKHTSK